jgi:PAS domain S-box-containing protein
MPLRTPPAAPGAEIMCPCDAGSAASAADAGREFILSLVSGFGATEIAGAFALVAAAVFIAGMLTMRLLSPGAAALALLRESELRFRKIAEASFDGMLVSEDGIVLTCNDRTTELFGCDESELIGRHISTLAPPDVRPRTLLRLANRTHGVYESELVRKDGRRTPIEISAVH